MLSLITDTLWKYIALVLFAILVALGIYTFSLRMDIVSLREDNAILKANKEKYEQSLAQAEVNQKVKIEYVDREVKVIEYKTQEKVKIVKEYVYDNNKSKCQNAIGVIRSSGL